MGLEVIDVNFQSARPPEEVKKMRLMMQLKRRKMNNVLFVKRKPMRVRKNRLHAVMRNVFFEEATAYKDRIVLDAKGEVERLQRLLPEFKAAPDLLRERLYIQTMEKVMANTPKAMLDGNNGNNLTVLPLEQIMGKKIGNKCAKCGQFFACFTVPERQNSYQPQPTTVAPIRQGRFN